jgi:rod shape-determining protein MreD
MQPERPALPTGAALLLVLLLLVAAGIQANLAGTVSDLTRGQPDLILVIVLVAALLSDAALGCLIGFGGGLLTAALVGETVGSYLVSRIIAGFVAGSLAGRFFRTNALVIAATVFLGSLVAEAAYGLAAPPLRGVSLVRYAEVVAANVVWNTALAVPVAYLLRRCGWGGGMPR